jgi:hypothetical protein
MPQAKEYVEPSHKSRETEMYLADDERTVMTKAFQNSFDYYCGKQKKQLKTKVNEPDDNVILNLVQLTADRTLSFLFPSMPQFELDPGEIENTPEEQWLTDAFEANGGLAFMQKIGLIGFLTGHVYVRVKPPNPGLPEQVSKFPRLYPYYPGQMVSYWNGDDHVDILWHELRWKSNDVEFLIDFVHEDNIWKIIEYSKEHGGNWSPTGRGGKWEHPYGPIVQWQHLPNPVSFYGIKEATDFELQDTLNLLVGEMAKIVRYHASPRTVAIGVPAEEIQETSIDSMWAIDDPDARIQNLEMQSELLPSRELAVYLQDMYLALRRVVILKGEVKDFQRVTNAGVRTVFMDALAKRNVLIKQYGHGLTNIAHRMSIVGDIAEGLTPSVKFADPLPIDDREKTELAIMRKEARIESHQTAALKVGNYWPDELEKMRQESEELILNPGPPPQLNPNTVDNEE